jgi:putative sterol carrier protein
MPAVTSDSTAAFFEELGRRGHEPLLTKATGTVRFDLVDGTRTLRWFVSLEKGDIAVSRKSVAADSVVRADKASFDQIAAGELNVMAAALRGEVAFDGDPKLLVAVQRLFPGRPRRRPRRRAASAARRRS